MLISLVFDLEREPNFFLDQLAEGDIEHTTFKNEIEYSDEKTSRESKLCPDVTEFYRNSRIFFISKKNDYNNHPIAVFNACNLKSSINYSQLWQFIIEEFDQIIDKEYILIYFHHGLTYSNRPSFNFMVGIYKSIDHRFSKNIKKLFVVHPGYYIRFTISLFKPFISSKFYNKIIYIEGLSELTTYCDVDSLEIDEQIIKYNNNFDKPISNNERIKNVRLKDSWLGLSFSVMITEKLLSNELVPLLVVKCCQDIEKDSVGLSTPGIFRVSSSRNAILTNLNLLKKNFNKTIKDPNLAANIIKKFFSSLPEPIFTFDAWNTAIELKDVNDENEQIRLVKNVFKNLPQINRSTLIYLVNFLQKVSDKESENNMNFPNLAICIGPSLLWAEDPTSINLADFGAAGEFLTVYFLNYEVIHKIE